MMTDIVERLRRDAEAWATTARNTVAGANTARLEREAADEIERYRKAAKEAEATAWDNRYGLGPT